tara:strand:+ start:10676 stop:12328 length:1653 start_codon:yes stop_codon:yes gene_type:complete
MCLSVEPYVDQTKEDVLASMKAAAEHDAVCDNITMSVMVLEDKSRVVTFFLPVQSPSATMFMYPCNPKFIGKSDDETRGLLTLKDKIPCYKPQITDYFFPERHAYPDLIDPPVYRSCGGLGSGGKGGCGGEGRQPMVLEQGKVCENADGSLVFQLKTSTSGMIKSLQEFEAMSFDEKITYRTDVMKVCLNTLLLELRKLEARPNSKVKVDKIFELDDGGQITFEAAHQFMDLLYPSLQGQDGCDILVAIPPPDETGRPSAKNEAAFAFAFHLDADEDDLPILGLAHNITPTTSLEELDFRDLKNVPQEYNYWIVSNVHPATAYAHIQDKVSLQKTRNTMFHVKFPDRKTLAIERCQYAGYNEYTWKIEDYIEKCGAIQEARQNEIFEMWKSYLSKQGTKGELAMPQGRTDEKLCVSNLKGAQLSPLTTTMHFPNRIEYVPVYKEQMYAAIAAAKEGVTALDGTKGWWETGHDNWKSGQPEADYAKYWSTKQYSMEEEMDGPSKRNRTHAEMEGSLSDIQINPKLGAVTASALRKEIGRRIGGPVTRSMRE